MWREIRALRSVSLFLFRHLSSDTRQSAKSIPSLKKADLKPLALDEKKFRYLLNEDAMATEKTAEGIRKFAADIGKLEQLVASKLNG